MSAIASWTTALSTHPPVTLPSMVPSASTYMLAPTSSGADPSTPTSSPAATRRSSRSHSMTVAAVSCAGLITCDPPDAYVPKVHDASGRAAEVAGWPGCTPAGLGISTTVQTCVRFAPPRVGLHPFGEDAKDEDGCGLCRA